MRETSESSVREIRKRTPRIRGVNQSPSAITMKQNKAKLRKLAREKEHGNRGWPKFIQPGAIVTVTNLAGVTRTGRVTRVLDSLCHMELRGGHDTVFSKDADIQLARKNAKLSDCDFCLHIEKGKFEEWCEMIQPEKMGWGR